MHENSIDDAIDDAELQLIETAIARGASDLRLQQSQETLAHMRREQQRVATTSMEAAENYKRIEQLIKQTQEHLQNT